MFGYFFAIFILSKRCFFTVSVCVCKPFFTFLSDVQWIAERWRTTLMLSGPWRGRKWAQIYPTPSPSLPLVDSEPIDWPGTFTAADTGLLAKWLTICISVSFSVCGVFGSCVLNISKAMMDSLHLNRCGVGGKSQELRHWLSTMCNLPHKHKKINNQLSCVPRKESFNSIIFAFLYNW